MLLLKLGILIVMGKGYYSGFLLAHLIHRTTHVIKHKLMEVVK